MFNHFTVKSENCPSCKQKISSIQHLIGPKVVISYNEKTGTWIIKDFDKDGHSKS